MNSAVRSLVSKGDRATLPESHEKTSHCPRCPELRDVGPDFIRPSLLPRTDPRLLELWQLRRPCLSAAPIDLLRAAVGDVAAQLPIPTTLRPLTAALLASSSSQFTSSSQLAQQQAPPPSPLMARAGDPSATSINRTRNRRSRVPDRERRCVPGKA
jgi:hypothetical protein